MIIFFITKDEIDTLGVYTLAKALIYFSAYITFFLLFYYLVPALGVRAKGN